MDFGIALPTAADSWRVTKEAEELGFTHAWFYDTQMLSADCFVAMGAAAVIQVVCPNWARTDLCGGREVTRVLTAKVGFRGRQVRCCTQLRHQPISGRFVWEHD